MSEAEYLAILQRWMQKVHMDIQWLLHHVPETDRRRSICRQLYRMDKIAVDLRGFIEHYAAIAAESPVLLREQGDNDVRE